MDFKKLRPSMKIVFLTVLAVFAFFGVLVMGPIFALGFIMLFLFLTLIPRSLRKYAMGSILGALLYFVLYAPCWLFTHILVVGTQEGNPWFLKFLESRCFYTYPFSWLLFFGSISVGAIFGMALSKVVGKLLSQKKNEKK